MLPIKVAAAVLNQTPLDWRNNERNIRRAIALAKEAGATILCLPELCISGYGCEDAFHLGEVTERSWAILESLLPETRGMIVSFGLPTLFQSALFNTACLAVDGAIAGLVAKQFLAGDGIHYEPRWFKPWTRGARALYRNEIPIGDLYFDIGGVRIGFEICEEAWVADRTGVDLARRGTDIILNPSASHFAFGKIDTRRRFVEEGSRAFSASYVFANLLGNEAGRAIYDGGAMIASGGRLVAIGPRLSFADALVTSATIDVALTRMSHARTHSFRPDTSDEGGRRIAVPFEFPARALDPTPFAEEAWEESDTKKEEEFARAEALALYDYLRKSRSHGFVVSLSGGADSAACAALVALSVKLGRASIGFEAYREKLAYAPRLREAKDPAALTRALLLTAYQATENSGPITKAAARTVAEAVGARHFELDIDPIVKGYLQLISRAIGRELEWSRDDVALQNIQARARSPSIWMLANLENSLLLATSNRSEAAVGYATMDGDTSGGLSPLAGIDKAFLQRWLRWLTASGPTNRTSEVPGDQFAIRELEVITRQAPTAELRPPSAEQTDEKDLMPYPILDAIERAAIRDKRAPREVLAVLETSFTEQSRRDLAQWVARFFRLWCRNQWKRERYAPSFHLDDENLDPKTWCRFPILSGGFEEELAELERDLAARP